MKSNQMSVHHLNCGTMHPFGAAPINGTGGLLARGRGVVHCLLVETDDGLALVDTGWGTGDAKDPTLVVRSFTALVGAPRDIEETAAHQVVGLGYDLSDVRHVVLTHLHLDHAGGLADFPQARVHVFAPEHVAAMRPRTLAERYAYVAEHWAHGPKWVLHSLAGDKWLGLDGVPVVDGLSPQILLVPMVGHTRGHCGVAVEARESWLLNCGDAYAYHGEVDPRGPSVPRPGNGLRSLMWRAVNVDPAADHRPALLTLAREHGDKVRLFCAHDPAELAEFGRDKDDM